MQQGQTRVVIALGSAQTLAWGSTYYLPAILAAPIAAELGLSTGLVFAAFSAALVVTAILGPWAGHRIDRFGGRDVLALSNLVFAAGLCTLGFTQGVATLFVAWLVIGVGMAMGLYEAAFSTLAGIYGRSARGAITGITLLAGFASTVCWPISAFIEAELGWRLTCFMWAAVHLVICLPLNRFLVLRRTQPPAATPETQAAGTSTGTNDRRNRAVFLLPFVFAVTWFTSTAMAAHLPRLLQEIGTTPAAAIAFAALVGPAQVMGRLLEFGVLQRFHALLSARLAIAAHPIGVLIVLSSGAPAAAMFTVLHGAGNGILTIAMGTLPLMIFGPAGYGFRQGLLMVPARFAQATSPFLFALLMERFGASSLMLTAALGVTALFALLALSPTSTAERA